MTSANPESQPTVPLVIFTHAPMPSWDEFRLSSSRNLIPDGALHAVLKSKELYQDRFIGLHGWELERAQQKRRATVVASFFTELGLVSNLQDSNRPNFEKQYARAEEQVSQLSLSDKISLVEDNEDSAIVGLINMLGRISDLDSLPRANTKPETEEVSIATEALKATTVKETELLTLKRGALYLLQITQ